MMTWSIEAWLDMTVTTTSTWTFRYARYVIVHGAGAQGLGLVSETSLGSFGFSVHLLVFSLRIKVKNTFYDFETDCTPLGNRP